MRLRSHYIMCLDNHADGRASKIPPKQRVRRKPGFSALRGYSCARIPPCKKLRSERVDESCSVSFRDS